MQIPKAAFFDADRNRAYAIPAIAISWFAFAYSGDFGKPAVLALYACWLPVLLFRPGLLLNGWHRVLPLVLLPAVALMSALWSDAPGVTLRAAMQYGSTILCGLIAARLVAVPTLSVGGLVGSLLVLAYSFANGAYRYDPVDGSYAFAGAFDSKNQLGYFASLAMIFGISTLFVFSERTVWRLLAISVTVLALASLLLSRSATSMLATAGAVALLPILRILFALPPRRRRLALMGILLLALGGVATAWQLGASQEVLKVFGKDATLTGRTYLWQRGIEIGGEEPFLGTGYYAFWVHGRAPAEILWDKFYIASRSGFHFHNIFVESYVELGVLGAALTLSTALLLIALSLRVLFNRVLAGSAMV